MSPGPAESGEVKRVLLQERRVIDDRLVYDTGLDPREYSDLLEQKGDLDAKLFVLSVGAVLTWDRLFTADELDRLSAGVDAAAQEVRGAQGTGRSGERPLQGLLHQPEDRHQDRGAPGSRVTRGRNAAAERAVCDSMKTSFIRRFGGRYE